MQIVKYDKRYLKGRALLRYVFCELPTGVLFSKLIERLVPSAGDLVTFESSIHKTKIDLKCFYAFLKEKMSLEEITSVKSSRAYEFHKNHL